MTMLESLLIYTIATNMLCFLYVFLETRDLSKLRNDKYFKELNKRLSTGQIVFCLRLLSFMIGFVLIPMLLIVWVFAHILELFKIAK